MSSSEPDRAALAQVTDHVTRGLAQLTQKWRGKAAIEALLSSHLTETQKVEAALWSILLLTLDTSTGAQLDQIAALVGEPRGTLGDTDLRTLLRARILVNRSSGAVDEILEILTLFFLGNFIVNELFPAGVLASASVLPSVPAARISDLLRRATAGGVGVQVVVPTTALGAFRFAPTDVTAPSTKGFSTTAQIAGGRLAGVY